MIARCLRATATIVALAATVAGADAQVYKCVDRAGRTTYQQQPCPDAQKGGRVDLYLGAPPARGDDDTAELAVRARQRQVAVGMTRAMVMQAYGSPQEMRPGRAGEDASEVWVYRRTDLDARVGFRGGVVAWVSGGEEAQGTAAAATPRQRLAPGQPCATLEADLGPAEAVEEEFDATVGRQVVRYRWSPTTADDERTFVVCDQGAVASVKRMPP
ncbi:MAG: DUF4124 domain-containing protein [Burkholderiales bacterium]